MTLVNVIHSNKSIRTTMRLKWTFWDIMEDFMTSLEHFDCFPGHFRPFSPVIGIGSLKKRVKDGRTDGPTDGPTHLKIRSFLNNELSLLDRVRLPAMEFSLLECSSLLCLDYVITVFSEKNYRFFVGITIFMNNRIFPLVAV